MCTFVQPHHTTLPCRQHFDYEAGRVEEVVVLETNGQMAYVEDRETFARRWVDTRELSRR
jgi:hypothetical protein